MIKLDNSGKILVIDDETDFTETIALRLQIRGFEVDTADEGSSGLEHLKSKKYDVVILDLKMPGINGEQVLEKIKAAKLNTEVIILTAHGSEEVAKETSELGAFCFITKPIDIERLVTVINLAIKSKKADD